jgi:hypothetical protein
MIKKLLKMVFPKWFPEKTVVSVKGVGSSVPQHKSVVKAVSAAKKGVNKKRGRPRKTKS